MPELSSRARRDIEALPPALRKKAEELIARLDTEPALGKKLLGPLEGIRSTRLGRAHRVLYRVEGAAVRVLTVRPRKDAYR
ncbi:MAG: hypothetical protein JWP66_1047 [Naasia sp.]|nr:hypothetical protein [Naasia sp.]